MKNRVVIFVTCTILLFLLSCKKQNVPGPGGSGTPTLYFAGADSNKAVYWKNGTEYFLPSTLGARVTSISATGNQVYFTGFEGPGTEVSFPGPAVYWNNGVKHSISYLNSILPANATSLFSIDVVSKIIFSEKNVYIGGSTKDAAVYWTNGTLNQVSVLDTLLGGSFVYDMAISGSDVYLAGTDKGYQPAFWKNGVETFLPLSDTIKNTPGGPFFGGSLNSICVYGNDVYCTGNDEFNVVYWKNGVEHILPLTKPQTPPVITSVTYAIAVSGNDLYITGHDGNKAVYWKNGTEYVLPSSGTAGAAGIAFLGSDVYIIGTDYPFKPVYWKNGQEISLPTTSTNGIGFAIAVVNE